jgi:hypothetical protein
VQIATDLETVNGIITMMQECHEEIGDVNLRRQRLWKRTEELQSRVRALPQRIKQLRMNELCLACVQLFRSSKELRGCLTAAKNTLMERGFTGHMPADIRLYCHTTYCHSTCRCCQCDRPHNCHSALHAATAAATATATATDR